MVQKLTAESAGKKTIGLTGVFGSGKSEVLKIFKDLGACVINSDLLAHEALEKDAKTYSEICDLFPDAVTGSGELDRKKIAAEIFSDAEKRKQLEGLVHPYVLTRIREQVLKAAELVIVAEVPLLFETGFDAYFDHTVTVNASWEVIKDRLRGKGFNEQEIRARLESQMPLEEKMKRSDFVLNNFKSLSETKQETEKVYKELCSSLKGE